MFRAKECSACLSCRSRKSWTGRSRERYGVAAINVVNDLTLEAVLAAAVEQRSPVIIQTSVKTVRSIGLDLLFAMWRRADRRHRGAGQPAPGPLPGPRGHLSACLRKGWNSVLFDGSSLPVRGEPAADRRGRGRGPALRRARGRRDRGHHGRRGRHRVRRGGAAAVAAGGARLHPGDRHRRVRAGDRERARHVPGRAARSTRSGCPTSWRPSRSRSRCTAAPG